MSVYTNEVLRPLSGQSTGIKTLLQRVGKSQGENVDPVLSKEDISFILRSLDVNPHSLLGAEILHRYFEGSQNLLDIFMGLLKDNLSTLSIRNRAVRDNDIVAAFNEGLNEELDKFQYWFSDLNDQFVDVSVKLKKMVSMKTSQVCNTDNNRRCLDGLKEDNALWQRLMTKEDNLRRQQEALLKMRDKERRKLVIYAKELEALHKEMNAKLKSIQSYEHFLKQQEKQIKGEAQQERNFILEKRGRGDYLSSGGNSENEDEAVKYSALNGKRSQHRSNVPNTREASTQKFGETVNPIKSRTNCENLGSCCRIMEENLELKSILREQHLRIESLTKRVAALSSQSIDWQSRQEKNRPS
uniref:DNA-directed RNA polymerase subunit beta n=1 Tax=Lygus hesperus TaxID=30085 RepID=A0A0A9WAP1_LYGHE